VQPVGCALKIKTVRKHIVCVLAAVFSVFALPAWAAPYVPANGDDVVAEIPSANLQARRARAYQRIAHQRPADLGLALQAAEISLALSLAESDPRFAGHAEAALAPWWNQPDPPVQVRLLRASILQGRHEFDRAVADLDAVIAAHPDNQQAVLSRAVIRQVQGRYDAANSDCAVIAGERRGLVSVTCRALVDSLTGKAAAALASLDGAVAAQRKQESPQVVLWALTVQAETAQRLGRVEAAEAYFKDALSLGVKDGYLTTAYADFLLEQNRPREVVDMLKDTTAIDPFLLRLTEAERRLNLDIWHRHADDLAERFAAAAARGDVVHRREEARFALHLRDDARRSLILAGANWEVQREPADAMILLEAAAAANPAAAQPVRDWIARNGLEDVRLNKVGKL
jgi:tetratricopeptide (TPR) repeat protein